MPCPALQPVAAHSPEQLHCPGHTTALHTAALILEASEPHTAAGPNGHPRDSRHT